MNQYLKAFLSFTFIFVLALELNADPLYFNYNGRILRPDDTPLNAASVDFTVQIISTTDGCVLYEETHNLDMSTSAGVFNLKVGSGARAGTDYEDTSTLDQAFDNGLGNITGLTCDSGTAYDAAPGDARAIRLTINEGTGVIQFSENINMASVPYARYATKLEGMGAGDFLAVDGVNNIDQTNLQNVFGGGNYTELMNLINGTSAQYADPAGANFTPTAPVDFNNQALQNLADPANATDAATKNYSDSYIGGAAADSASLSVLAGGADIGKVLTWNGTTWVANNVTATDATKLPLAGGTMTGDIDMGGNDILNSGFITMSANTYLHLGTYAADPSGLTAGHEGVTWYNSTSDELKIWDGAAAQVIGGFDIGTAAGDAMGADAVPNCLATEKLQMSAGPVYTWSCVTDATGGDFESDGSVAMTGNIRLNGNYLSGDGDSEGVFVGNTGRVNIGGATTFEHQLNIESNDVTLYTPTSGAVRSPLPDGIGLEIKNTGNSTGTGAFLSLSSDNNIGLSSQTFLGNISDPSNYDSTFVIGASTGNASYEERMRIDVNGNVGIGLDGANNPSISTGAKLDVEGRIVSGPAGTATGETGAIRLEELAANGTNYVSLRAPDSVATDVVWTLPGTDGTNGQVLSTNGSGVLSWQDSGVGDILNNGNSGAVVIGSNDNSLSLEANNNVAIQIQANGDIAFDTDTLFIDEDVNRLGLRNTSPDEEIHLGDGTQSVSIKVDASSAGIHDALILENTSGGTNRGPAIQYIDSGGSAGRISVSRGPNNSVSQMVFETRSSSTVAERMRIDTSGNLGVGTTTPEDRLDVAGSIRSAARGNTAGEGGQIRLEELATSPDGGADGVPEFVGFRAPDSVASDLIWTLPGTDGTNGQVLSTNGSGVLSWASAGTGDFESDGSVPMAGNIQLNGNYLSGDGGNEGVFVDGAGNVGIGISLPLAKFHINGGTGSLSTGVAFGDGDTGIFENSDDYLRYIGTAHMFDGQLRLDNGTAAAPVIVGTENSSGLYFESGGGNGKVMISTEGTERLRVDHLGNVGIGTNAPTNILDVNPAAAPASVAGRGVRIKSQDASSNSAGGNLLVTSGQGEGSGGAGGDIELRSGNAGSGSTGNGGKMTIRSGSAQGTGNGGNIDLVAGNGTGGAATGNGGNINITAGNSASSGSGGPGDISLTAGNASAGSTDQDGGDITLSGGLNNGGNDGNILLNPNSGNVGIGTISPSSKLEINGDLAIIGIAAPAVSSTGQGRIYFDSASSKFRVSENGGGYVDLVSGGTGDFESDGSVAMTGRLTLADGSQATPSMAFSSDNQLGFYYGGTNVIGITDGGTQFATISPTNGLVINSGPMVRTDGYRFHTDTDTGITNPADNTLGLVTGGNQILTVDPSFQVGINNNNPSFNLDVTGDMRVLASGGSATGTYEAYSSSSTDGAVVNFYRANGASGAPAAVSNGDLLGGINIGGYAPSGSFQTSVQILSSVNGAPSGTNIPSDLTFALNDGSGMQYPVLMTADNLMVTTGKDLVLADDDNSAWTGFRAPSVVTTSVIYTLPPADGSNGQVLSTNGSGVLSWQAGGSGDFQSDGSVAMTGQFDAVLGNQGSPGISFGTDANTGLFSPAADNVAITTGGNERMRIASDGSVGIGESSPNFSLDVSSASSSSLMRVRSTDAFGWSSITYAASDGGTVGWVGYGNPSATSQANQMYMEANGARSIGLYTNSTERIHIASDGKVGIGTSSPDGTLHVEGTDANRPVFKTSGSSGSDYGIEIQGARNGTIDHSISYINLRNDRGGGAYDLAQISGAMQSGATNQSKLRFSTNDGSSLNVQMVIDKDGNVGLGNEAPVEKLEVEGRVVSGPAGTGAGETGSIRFKELAAGGSNYVGLRAPDAVTSDIVWTLPAADGSSGQILSTNGSGVLSWTAAGSGDFESDGSVAMTGQFDAVLGNQGNPGISFGTDANTGLFSPAADTVAITTGGSEKMRIASDGKVGIGVNSTDSILRVEDTTHPVFRRERTTNGTSTAAALRLERTYEGGVGGVGMGVHQDFYVETATEGVMEPIAQIGARTTVPTAGDIHSDLFFRTFFEGGSNEAMIIKSTGAVGVGVDPTESFHMKFDTNSSVSNKAENKGTGGNSVAQFWAEGGATANDWIKMGVGNSGSAWPNKAYIEAGNTVDDLTISAPDVIFDTTGAATMTLNGSGNLQVHTENEIRFEDNTGGEYVGFKAPATVTGSQTYTLPPADGSSGQVLTTNGSGVLTWSSAGGGSGDLMSDGSVVMTDQFFGVVGNAGAPSYTFDGDPDTGVFKAADDVVAVSTGGAEAIRIDSGGNLGVGTTSPDAILHVEPSAAATSTKGKGIKLFAQDSTGPTSNTGGSILLEVGDGAGGFGSGNFSADVKNGMFFVSKGSNTNYTPGSAPDHHLYLDNSWFLDSNSVFITHNVRNTANDQYFFTGAFSNSGAGNYSPSYAWVQQTGASTYAERMRIDGSGQLGIGTTSPESLVHIDGSGAGKGLCVTSDDTCGSVPAGGEISAETTLNTGADYAEYFAAEVNDLEPGDLVGLNPKNGLVRAYQKGDALLGVISTNPGVIGNSELRGKENVALVGLVGQLPVKSDQVYYYNGFAYANDGSPVGFALADGSIYINISSADIIQNTEIAKLKNRLDEKDKQLRGIASVVGEKEERIKALENKNSELQSKYESLEDKLERLEKIVDQLTQ